MPPKGHGHWLQQLKQERDANITTYSLKKGGGENDPLLNWHRNS